MVHMRHLSLLLILLLISVTSARAAGLSKRRVSTTAGAWRVPMASAAGTIATGWIPALSFGGGLTGTTASVSVSTLQGWQLTYPSAPPAEGDVWAYDAATGEMVLEQPSGVGGVVDTITWGAGLLGSGTAADPVGDVVALAPLVANTDNVSIEYNPQSGLVVDAQGRLAVDSDRITISAMGGDLTGPSNSVTVTKVQGYAYTYPGSPPADNAAWAYDSGSGAFVLEVPAAGTITGQIAGGGDTAINTLNVSVDGQLEASIAGSTMTVSGTSGRVVQIVYAQYSDVITGSTSMPADDTIPQSTEGFEVMTATITPRYTDSYILISGTAHLNNPVSSSMTAAIFRNSETDAIAVSTAWVSSGTQILSFPLSHVDVVTGAGAITYAVRVGINNVGTVTFNGYDSGRQFGTIPKSRLILQEVRP